jgi:membrane protein YqaA with SNARE-associated domain
MESIIDFLYQVKDFLNPKIMIDTLLDWLGGYVYLGLIFIIFAETGLAVGFFLPGDSLLVVAGLFAAAGKLNLWVMMITLFIAAVVGDAVGYYSGKKIGPAIFKRPKSSEKSPRFLRKTRRKNHHYRSIRSDCPHVRADCRGRGRYALQGFSDFQRLRRISVGFQYASDRLFSRRIG